MSILAVWRVETPTAAIDRNRKEKRWTQTGMAWQIIDYWIKNDYGGDKDALISEVGDLDNYVYRIVETIERCELDTDDIGHCAGLVELRMWG